MEKLYLRILLVTDYIIRISIYAKRLYQELKAMF